MSQKEKEAEREDEREKDRQTDRTRQRKMREGGRLHEENQRFITVFTVCCIFFTQLLHSTAEVLTPSDFLKG